MGAWIELKPEGVEVHTYPADHRLNWDERESYDKPRAALA
jgi:hypothetical protein